MKRVLLATVAAAPALCALFYYGCAADEGTASRSASGGGGAGSSNHAGAAGSSSTTGSGGTGAPSGSGGSSATGTGGSTGGGAMGSGGAGGATTGGTGGSSTVDAGTTVEAGPTGPVGPHVADGGVAFDGPVFYIAINDGTLHAFQEGTWKEVGTWSGLPILDAARGIDADPKTGIIYMSHGGAGPVGFGTSSKTQTGSLLAWSILTNSVVFDKKFTHGVDQIGVGDGLVYIPSGEFTGDTNWYYVKASDGTQIGVEPGGKAPHDTIFRNGHRYYGGTEDTYLYVLGLPSTTKVGPSPSGTAGVRPFTINASETRAYITWSNYRGFSVGDLTTGKIIKSISFGTPCGLAAPSHGMSLAPDGSEIYVLDTCINQVKVYDSSDDPKLKVAIPFEHKMYPGTENPCVWDCDKDGWITHSRDGKYLYIGDGGDVIDTATHKVATYLPLLANCRHGFIEIDWSNGTVIGTPTHVGMGY